ncbi:hypothetical protein ACFQH9_19185 [Pseudonocardia lutea]|uniref:NIPSNAP protein n=1 Tax=Pseudonocardia lutea TaxID=2172015 RepID=A0ABW1ICL6_9PSEU
MRPVFCMDITDFRPMVSANPQRFLRWATRKFRADPDGLAEETNAATRMQSQAGSPDSIEMIGAWYAAGISGNRQFQAFSLYECHGGWPGGWRRMVELYRGVPDSLFLSAIDGVRFGATSLPLVGAPGCPTTAELRDQGVHGPYALIEFADVAVDSGLDYLTAARELRAPYMADHGFRLAGLYEIAFSRGRVCTLWAGNAEGQVGLMRARDANLGLDDAALADPRMREWEAASAKLLRGDAQEYLLAAYPGPVLTA